MSVMYSNLGTNERNVFVMSLVVPIDEDECEDVYDW